ncbi:MAG: hypothetical protein ACFCVF_14155 [Kineosporiaceae bacterium]
MTARDGRRQGEDWAELIVHVAALGLGVPTAQVRLARRAGDDGSLSRDAKPAGCTEAQHGSVLLQGVVEDFDRRSRERRGHSLANVERVLDRVEPPAESDLDHLGAFGVFCGYLVLDALVAGRDRHSDNWSITVTPEGARRLMASYDHATSLGFNLTDDRRARMLANDVELERWVVRGTAWRFEGGRDVTLVEWARRGAAMAGPSVRSHWRNALVQLDLALVDTVAADIDAVSGVTRTFVLSVLERNRRRLLDEL